MIVASEPSLVISDILCQVLTGSTHLFFFVEPIMGEVPTEFNFFFNFERILYRYEIKAYFLNNLSLSNFFQNA